MGERLNRLVAMALAAGICLSNTPAFAEAGDFLFRLRGIAVMPADGGAEILGNPSAGLDIDTAFVPEIDLTYFMTDHLALELIAASARHEVTLETPGGNVDLGDVRLLPPTLTLQYHFRPDAVVRPYVGAGLNFTLFMGADAPGFTIDYDNAFGAVLQAGFDVGITENTFLNFDFKKVFLDTDVALNGGAVQARAEINPIIAGAGIGIKF